MHKFGEMTWRPARRDPFTLSKDRCGDPNGNVPLGDDSAKSGKRNNQPLLLSRDPHGQFGRDDSKLGQSDFGFQPRYTCCASGIDYFGFQIEDYCNDGNPKDV